MNKFAVFLIAIMMLAFSISAASRLTYVDVRKYAPGYDETFFPHLNGNNNNGNGHVNGNNNAQTNGDILITPLPDREPFFTNDAKEIDPLADLNCNERLPKATCEEYKRLISQNAEKYFPSQCRSKISKVKYKLVLYYQIRQESDFRKDAINWADPKKGITKTSYGLAQFTEDTANTVGIGGSSGALDPVKALEGQADYMGRIMTLSYVGCDYKLALAGYNAGPYNNAVKAGRIPQNSWTPDYVNRISSNVESKAGTHS